MGVGSVNGKEYDRADVARLCRMRSGAPGARPELRRAVLHGCPHDGHLLPPGLSGASRPVGQCFILPSAAAAEAAGFRPCLRCRPETAPFCSAWIGSRATVERALRLIVEDRALDQEGATVERLAARLGMGVRQLTRLFARHLQASPSKVARTARVQRAKRLIDETSLPMTEIAIRAGFGSLRRFNSVFVEVYGRPPTELRRTRRSAGTEVKAVEVSLTRIAWPCNDAR